MGLRLVNKNITFPTLYPKVERKDSQRINGEWIEGYEKVGGFKLRDHVDYMPQKGLQELACACDANVIFCCGESQIGKTFLTLLSAIDGVGMPNYTARIISTRLQDSKKGSSILRDAMNVLGGFAGCEISTSDYPTFFWKQWNNSVQFIHSNYNVKNPAEWNEFQDFAKKNQASFFGLDEVTQMKEFKMFAYWLSRNRDDSGRTPKTLATFNFVHEHFTTTMLKDGGYLGDDWFVRPEMVGKIRYFYVEGDTEHDIVWADSVEELDARLDLWGRITEKEKALGVTPRELVKSFTMFTGETADNVKLLYATKGQNIGNLHNTGKTQRAILKRGYAGPIDNEENQVTRQMIHNLWSNPVSDDTTMYATMDISSGAKGNDKCPMIIWRGDTVIALKFFQGSPQEISPWIKKQLHEYKVPIENFAYDATGHGYWMQGLTNGIAVTSNARAKQELDEYGNVVQAEQFFNLRSQLLGKMKVMFERGDISFAIDKYTLIPYGKDGQMSQIIDILFDEINVFSIDSSKNTDKIYYRNKEEYKSKFKHSPDLMDAIILKAIFHLDARERKKPSPRVKYNAYDGLYKRPHINPYQRQNQRLYANYHA